MLKGATCLNCLGQTTQPNEHVQVACAFLLICINFLRLPVSLAVIMTRVTMLGPSLIKMRSLHHVLSWRPRLWWHDRVFVMFVNVILLSKAIFFLQSLMPSGVDAGCSLLALPQANNSLKLAVHWVSFVFCSPIWHTDLPSMMFFLCSQVSSEMESLFLFFLSNFVVFNSKTISIKNN